MSLPLPGSLSPSKVSSFKDCALAFRLSSIDKIPEPPSLPAAKGTAVHRALELLMVEEEPSARSPDAALEKLERAASEVLGGEEYEPLNLGEAERREFVADAATLVGNYFRLEDPSLVRVVGTEMKLSAEVDGVTLSGIIDRLELDDRDELVVSDYKTGRAPGKGFEGPRLTGVHFYALLCERTFGQRPSKVQLLHLREPIVISAIPTDQSVNALIKHNTAIWSAVQLGCRTENFRPNPGRYCSFCAYHSFCPAMGGSLAAVVSGAGSGDRLGVEGDVAAMTS